MTPTPSAGQGLHTYDVNGFSAQPDPTACNIRIEGVAPGASMVGLDVFGTFEDTTESNFLQAINYAVETDHVNVINESFGSNPFPAVTALNATKQFNDAAVAAGVVVTVSSGDAGSTNTIGSPASDPKVISVGASTDFRFYAQTNYAAADYFATTGWLNNNISSLSSGGYERDRRHDRPGRAGRSELRLVRRQPGLRRLRQLQGPVIPHRGKRRHQRVVAVRGRRRCPGHPGLPPDPRRQPAPTPALVKQILVSTATDLGAPADEQGAGLLNSYRAVQLAESISGPRTARPPPTGSTLLKSPDPAQRGPGAWPAQANFKVTSLTPGQRPQTVHTSGRTLGPDQDVQTGSVTLSDTASPQFINFSGPAEQLRDLHLPRRAGHEPARRLHRLSGQPGQGEQPTGPDDPDRPDGKIGRALAAAGRRELRQRRRRQPGGRHLDRRDLQRYPG